MTEPQRWLESTGLDPDVGELLRAAQPPRAIAPIDLQRSTRRIARLARLPAVVAGAWWWLRRALAFHPALLGSAGVLVALALAVPLVRRTTSPPDAASVDSTPTAAAAIAPATPIAVPVEPAAPIAVPIGPAAPVAVPIEPTAPVGPTVGSLSASRNTSAKTNPVPHPAPAPLSDDMAAEVAALERIRAKVAGDPCGTLGRLDEHERRFPRPQLGVEREVLRIEALGGCGQRDEARTRARALLERSPGTLYESELRQVLAK